MIMCKHEIWECERQITREQVTHAVKTVDYVNRVERLIKCESVECIKGLLHVGK